MNINKSTALSSDLNNFIYGVTRRNFQNATELTKIGITLLKTFPAARDAVLEYFSMVFHEAVNVSINTSDYENDSNSNGPLEGVSMIGPELCALGPSWAPFIAPWCINLIMDIATEKANLPNQTLQNTEPVRVLLDITTQNLTLLNSEERAKCIDMMLGCRACSWAVGWVGRAEPALVAPRALALGPDAARAVLAHLANHPPALYHVTVQTRQMFQEAIREDSKAEKKRDIIPYLLNLASKSDIVLKALIQDIEETLTPAVVARLGALCASQRHTAAWEGLGPAQLVALLVQADVPCFLLLVKHAHDNLFCRQLLEYLLQKLEYECLFPDNKIPLIMSAAEKIHTVRDRLLDGNQLEQYSVARLLILVCYTLPSEFVDTIAYLLQYSRNDTTLALLVRIISGTITMHTPNDSPDMSTDTDRYTNFIKAGVEQGLRGAMMADEQIKKCFIEGDVPEDQKTYLHHYCDNVIKLLRWENSGKVGHMRGRWLSASVESSLYVWCGAWLSRLSVLRAPGSAAHAARPAMPAAHALAMVLDRVDLSGTKSPPPSVEVIMRMVQSTVKYFFRCLHEKDTMRKLFGVQTACRLLRKLCLHSKLARAVALRELLETAMLREEKAFGSKPVVQNTVQTKHWSDDELLIHLNQKQGPITQLTQSHTSVFHAGIIGKGVRKHSNETDTDIPTIFTTNNELLMGALMSCMDGNSGVVEGATSISLLLVELLSPDVMYNGLPWPDEDFTKQVSIERELYMRAAVSACVVSRAGLRRAAAARPALCLASALLRAVPAAHMHRCAPHLDRHTSSAELARERGALNELLALMTLGQLLPPPLTHIIDLVEHLTPSELVQVLRDCLWNYTRDHVPSPALFTCDSSGLHWRDPSTCKPPASYTDTLRLIIQKRIAKLGQLYPIMFLNLEKAEN